MSQKKTCPTCTARADASDLFCLECSTPIAHILADDERATASIPLPYSIERRSSEGSSLPGRPVVEDDYPRNPDALDLPADFTIAQETRNDEGAWLDRDKAAFAFNSPREIEQEYRPIHGRPISQRLNSSDGSGSETVPETTHPDGPSILGQVFGAVVDGVLQGAGISGDLARRGNSPFGEVLLRMSGGQIYIVDGDMFNSPIYRVDGNKLREPGVFGSVLARLRDNHVVLGDSFLGDVIATLNGAQVCEGLSSWGRTIATVPSGNAGLGMAAAFYLLHSDPPR